MRVVVDLRHTDQGVEGEVLREGAAVPELFSGWLELLRLLEVGDPSSALRTMIHAGASAKATPTRSRYDDQHDGGTYAVRTLRPAGRV